MDQVSSLNVSLNIDSSTDSSISISSSYGITESTSNELANGNLSSSSYLSYSPYYPSSSSVNPLLQNGKENFYVDDDDDDCILLYPISFFILNICCLHKPIWMQSTCALSSFAYTIFIVIIYFLIAFFPTLFFHSDLLVCLFTSFNHCIWMVALQIY